MTVRRVRPGNVESHRGTFRGAKEPKGDDNTLEGRNVLGRLRELLREQVRAPHPQGLKVVEAPGLATFQLYGQPIGRVERE